MPDALNILLNPVGSAGDVHPLIGIGGALKARGHKVTVLVNAYFKPLVEKMGLGYVEQGTLEQFETILHHPDAWHPRKALGVIFGNMVRAIVPMCVEQLKALVTPGNTVICGSSLAMGTRVAQDLLGTPTVTVHLAPSLFRSMYKAPKMGGVWMPDGMPHFLKRAFWWFADWAVVDPAICPPLNEYRRTLGLAPVKRPMNGWWNSPTCVLAMFPKWFAEPQPDWPSQVHQLSFPRFDERELHEPDSELETFLAAGDKPLVFTPGSAMLQGEKFFAAAADACRRLNRRGILLTRFKEQLPTDLPPNVRHFDYVPLSYVLPRAAAMVYHGGIGTCSQALAAGIAHLIMPMAHDQHDNAARVEKMGVGASLEPKHFTGAKLAARLESLLTNRDLPGRAWEIARKFEQEKPIEEACELIEQAARGEGLAAASPLKERRN